GYQLALDDFTMSPDWERFLPFIHIIKFDLRATPLKPTRLHHLEKATCIFLKVRAHPCWKAWW
ncbi:hypothetical protein NL539_26975, partial [Aeromonas sp. CPF2-S1]|nr:hypothetical protein [Aeromonas sp. CPF2-S1]